MSLARLETNHHWVDALKQNSYDPNVDNLSPSIQYEVNNIKEEMIIALFSHPLLDVIPTVVTRSNTEILNIEYGFDNQNQLALEAVILEPEYEVLTESSVDKLMSKFINTIITKIEKISCEYPNIIPTIDVLNNVTLTQASTRVALSTRRSNGSLILTSSKELGKIISSEDVLFEEIDLHINNHSRLPYESLGTIYNNNVVRLPKQYDKTYLIHTSPIKQTTKDNQDYFSFDTTIGVIIDKLSSTYDENTEHHTIGIRYSLVINLTDLSDIRLS